MRCWVWKDERVMVPTLSRIGVQRVERCEWEKTVFIEKDCSFLPTNYLVERLV